jgi:hypothetical protein
MNNIPMIKNGAITTIEPGFPVKEWKKIVPAMNASINRIPPAPSHFHETNNIAVTIRTGILCIRKPSIFIPKDSFPSNASSENMAIKRIDTIASTRGIQYNTLDFIYRLVNKCIPEIYP